MNDPAHPSVLVVEDDTILRKLVSEQIRGFGYEVLQAGAAADALAIADGRCLEAGRCRLDVLLADLQLPGDMDGLALAREIRIRCPGIGVLFTTGAAPDQEPAQAVPGARLLIKPFRRAALAEHLRQLVAGLPGGAGG